MTRPIDPTARLAVPSGNAPVAWPRWRAWWTAMLCVALAGCALPKGGPASVVELLQRPAERQLVAGLRFYDDARYADAEKALVESLGLSLASPLDRASAHKTLAFIYCTSARLAECEAAFRAARREDDRFVLNRAEAGHPIWGPVYEKSRH